MFSASVILPPVVAGLLLSAAMPARDAWCSILGGWRWAFDPAITSLPFYRRVAGLDDVGRSLAAIGLGTVVYLLVIGVPGLVAIQFRSNHKLRWAIGGVSLIAMAMVMLLSSPWLNWQEAGRPLVVCAIVVLAIAAARLRRDFSPDAILATVFAIFALVLVAKIALNVRLYHYGFALAAPALTLSIAAALCWMPRWINHRGGAGPIVRGAVLGALVVLCARYALYTHQRMSEKTTPVGSGADAFRADARGQSVNDMLALLDPLPTATTVATVPEGVIVNYLSRRENPTPYIVLMPPEVLMFGQARILESFEAHPPDVIVAVKSDASEYGFQSFNADYGRDIARWIDANYTLVLPRPDAPLPYAILRHRGR